MFSQKNILLFRLSVLNLHFDNADICVTRCRNVGHKDNKKSLGMSAKRLLFRKCL